MHAESLANVLAIHLLQKYCTQKPVLHTYKGGLSKHKLRHVTEYMHAHLNRQPSLAELAALVQMSQGHFIRTFKQATGLTPHRYLIQLRIEQARALLANELSIAEVAELVGYQSHSHFTTRFRGLTGLTPTAYRETQ